MDTTIGQALEKSFDKDTPWAVRSKGAMKGVVSTPDKLPEFSRPAAIPKAKPTDEKRFTIEALPESDRPAGMPDQGDAVNSQALQHLLLLKHFGIDSKPTSEETQKLKAIWEFAKVGSSADTIAAILRLRNKLGTPSIGESLLDRVYRHVHLRQIQRYEQEV